MTRSAASQRPQRQDVLRRAHARRDPGDPVRFYTRQAVERQQHGTHFRLHRTTDEGRRIRTAQPLDIEFPQHFVDLQLARAIDDETETSTLPALLVRGQEHDGPSEERIEDLGHGDQQTRRLEVIQPGHGATLHSATGPGRGPRGTAGADAGSALGYLVPSRPGRSRPGTAYPTSNSPAPAAGDTETGT